MFADVVGSTALAERHDPEDYRAMMEVALDAFETAVRRHDGTVAQLLGDGILAFFGAPVAHDDDPVRAASAAREIVEAARGLAVDLRSRGIEFAVRCGIDHGLVVVGPVGGDARREYLAMGDPVNVAARLQAIAPPMGVLLSPSVAALIRSRFEVHEVGAVDLRGRMDSLAAWALGGALAIEERPPAPDRAPIVGRASELIALGAAVDALDAGLGRTVLIVGEPGLGKTRLVEECRALVTHRGSARARGRPAGRASWIEVSAVAHGERSAYQLVISLVRALTGASGRDDGNDRALLDEAMPSAAPARRGALARLLGLPLAGDERADLALFEPSHLPRLYSEGLRDLLCACAERVPLVVTIEDLHWADPSSADIVSAVLSVVDDHPLLLLLTTRPDPAGSGWRLAEAAREHAGAGLVQLTLGPLDVADTDRLAARYLGAASPHIRLVRERSDGNPLFVEELSRSLLERAASGLEDQDGGGAAIPDALQGVLLARLDRLPASARRTARVAAVIGRRFSMDVLEAVAGGDAARPGLAALERAGLVELFDPVRPPTFAFRHTLIQESAYASLLHADARRLHEAVARALLTCRRYDDPSLAPTLGRHFAAAALHREAIDWYRSSIAAARAAFANEEALALLDAALASAAALETEAATGLGRTVTALERDRGDVLALIGRMSDAREAFQRALGALPEEDVVERARLRCSVGPTLEAEQRYGEADAIYQAAEADLGEPPGDDTAWWEAWLDVRLRRCALHYWAGQIDEMERVIGGLEGSVRLHGNGRQRAAFHSRTAMMLEQRHRYRPDELVIEHERLALSEMVALGSVSGAMQERFALGFAEMWGGHLDEAERDMLGALEVATRIGDAAVVARGDAYVAVLRRFQHRRREALEAGERTLVACADLGPGFQPYVGIGHAMRGSSMLEAGDSNGARAELEQAVAAMDAWGRLRGARYPMAWIALLPLLAVEVGDGNLDSAVEISRQLLDPTAQVLPTPLTDALATAVAHAASGAGEAVVRQDLEAVVAAAEADGRL